MIMKRVVCRLWVAMTIAAVAALGMTSCESLLGGEGGEVGLSYLEKDVDFEAVSVTAKRFSGIASTFQNYDNFTFEFVGADRSGVKDVLTLDLLAPKGTTDPAGEYVVGYGGDFVALSRYDVLDPTTNISYSGGSFYAEAMGGHISNYYGFLTEGRITISREGENEYRVVVNAKSMEHSVQMTYAGDWRLVEVTGE